MTLGISVHYAFNIFEFEKFFIFHALNISMMSRVFAVILIDIHLVNINYCYFFDSELNPSKLYYVTFFELVFDLLVIVFEASDN